MVYNPKGHIVHETAARMKKSFELIVNNFKEQEVQSAIRSYSNASSKPNSSVAAFIEQTRKKELQELLVTSSGTLLVVPNTLLSHWEVRFT
jgi:hypothetical protein